MSDKLTMSVDGTTWYAIEGLSIKSHSIDVTSFGSAYSYSIPTGAKIIEMELPVHPFHPVGGDFGGAHKLHIRHGEQVTVYDAYLYSAPSEIPGGAVRLMWHTVIQIIPGGSGYQDSGRMLSKALPALIKEVLSPCDHGGVDLLEEVIIHLNDRHKWSREQIADWLDSLDVDLAFPVPDTIPSNIN